MMAPLLAPSAVMLCVVGLSYGAATMTNSWAVQVTSRGREAADALASKYGFVNLGLIGNLRDMYHFILQPQIQHRNELKRSVMSYHSYITAQLSLESNVGYVKQQKRRNLWKKGYDIPTDPMWEKQWSLHNTGQLNATDVGRDLNVERAWLQGITGCDSVVAIVDDGVEYTHSDLAANYLSSIQNDFLDHDGDPFPSTVDGVRESHGTRSAGVVGMEKGNNVCGIGVAYSSLVTGLRLISEPGPTDLDEAEALSWMNDVIDIYSNGWGPEDDGRTVLGPGELLQMAMEMSISEGRGGLGSIYVFASGNGGPQDTCAADGYTNSIHTISVGSAASSGKQSAVDEPCSAKMVVAFDSDPYQDRSHVVTADVDDSCSANFTTSAATSLVSGVLALLLDANPDLTWRDVQYLLAYTSNPDRLVDGEWSTNGAGLRVSHKFGFGAIDAEALVSRGRHWISVPAQLSQEVVPVIDVPPHTPCCNFTRIIPEGENITVMFSVDSYIISLEHVVLLFNMHFVPNPDPHPYYTRGDPRDLLYYQWQQRGMVQVALTSPSGTTSTLLPLRPGDLFPGSYEDWPLMSVHFWGEDPSGDWTLVVTYASNIGAIRVEVPKVTFYGTSQVPEAVSRIPAECSSKCDPSRGCAADGAGLCDACQKMRVAFTLRCASTCPEGLTQRNGYCYYASEPECACPAPGPHHHDDDNNDDNNDDQGGGDHAHSSAKVSPTAVYTRTAGPRPSRSLAPCGSSVVPMETSTAPPTTKSPKNAARTPGAGLVVSLATTLTLAATLIRQLGW